MHISMVEGARSGFVLSRACAPGPPCRLYQRWTSARGHLCESGAEKPTQCSFLGMCTQWMYTTGRYQRYRTCRTERDVSMDAPRERSKSLRTTKTERRGFKRGRLSVRISEEQKVLLQQAADLQGRSLSDFVIESAQHAAEAEGFTARSYQTASPISYAPSATDWTLGRRPAFQAAGCRPSPPHEWP